MKDMTSVATTMMTDEEKAEIEKQMNAGNPNVTSPAPTPAVAAEASRPHSTAGPAAAAAAADVHVHTTDGSDGPIKMPVPSTTHAVPSSEVVQHGDASHPPTPSVKPTSPAEKERERQELLRKKAEQREKLREHEKARRKAMEERVAMLTKKMLERLRPFVEAKDPGGKDDPETRAFEDRMKREVEDLKLESFGVEVRSECWGYCLRYVHETFLHSFCTPLEAFIL